MRTKIATAIVALLVIALTLAWPIAIASAKINVSSLSAISANIGNVTAGTISGITISGVTITGSTVTGGTVNADFHSSGLWNGGGAGFACIDDDGFIFKSGAACN